MLNKVFSFSVSWCIDLKRTSGLKLGPLEVKHGAFQYLVCVFPLRPTPALFLLHFYGAPCFSLFPKFPRLSKRECLIFTRHDFL